MSVNPRSITVAATNYPGGIRCYTKIPGGEVREASLALSNDALSKAVSDGKSDIVTSTAGWKSSTLPFKCHPQSTLCTVSWDEKDQSVFYQDETGALREQRFTEGKGWKQTDLNQKNVKLGSNIASVCSPKHAKVMLFYQHVHGKICSLTGESGRWMEPVTLGGSEAYACTGIGAIEWDDLNHVRIYIQHKNFHVREWCRDASGKWTVTESSVVKTEFPIGDITAIAWGTASNPQIRLYIQDKDSRIVEYMNSGASWSKGEFTQRVMPNSDVIAFIRKVKAGPGFCINVMWAGQDQILKQCIYDGHKWLSPADLAYLGFPGNCPGVWTNATIFSDELIATTVGAGQLRKVVREVHIHLKRDIRGIGVRYADSDKPAMHGNDDESGCETEVFELPADEDITAVWYRTDRRGLAGIQFGTSGGNTSGWFGSREGEFGSWNGEGHALIGFFGAQSKQDGITGLMPIWSQIEISTKHEEYKPKLAAAKGELLQLPSELTKVTQQAGKLQAQWNAIEGQKKAAASALAELTESAEILCSLERQNADGQVRVTKRREKFVADQLKVCKQDAEGAIAFFGKISELTGAVSPAAETLGGTISGLHKKATQADLKSFMEGALEDLQCRERELREDLEERQGDKTRAKGGVEDAARRYKEKRDKQTSKQTAVHEHKNVQNPFGSHIGHAHETKGNSILEEAQEYIRDAQAKFDYHAARCDFLEYWATRVGRQAKELQQALDQLNGELKASAVKKVVDEVDALGTQCAVCAKEAAELGTLLKALESLLKQLPGKTDSKGFATALLPIIEKAGAHAGLKTHFKVEVDTMLAVTKKIVG